MPQSPKSKSSISEEKDSWEINEQTYTNLIEIRDEIIEEFMEESYK